MQRHFSNRGEALAQVTAARMIASKKEQPGPVLIPQRGQRRAYDQWFPEPPEAIERSKRKLPRSKGGDTPLL